MAVTALKGNSDYAARWYKKDDSAFLPTENASWALFGTLQQFGALQQDLARYQRSCSFPESMILGFFESRNEAKAAQAYSPLPEILLQTGSEANSFFIGDGQQRMTAMSLIFLAIAVVARGSLEVEPGNWTDDEVATLNALLPSMESREKASGWLASIVEDEDKNLVYSPSLTLLGDEKEEGSALANNAYAYIYSLGSNAYAGVHEFIASDDSPSNESPGGLLLRNFLLTYELISKEVVDGTTFVKTLEDFNDTFRFTVSVFEKGSDMRRHFMKINSSATPLSEGQLSKPAMSSSLCDVEDSLDASVMRYWSNRLENDFWSTPADVLNTTKNGHKVRTNLEVALLSLVHTYSSENPEKRLMEEIPGVTAAMLRHSGQKKFLKTLKRHQRIYQSVVERDYTGGTFENRDAFFGSFGRALTHLGNSRKGYSLLLLLDEIKDEERLLNVGREIVRGWIVDVLMRTGTQSELINDLVGPGSPLRSNPRKPQVEDITSFVDDYLKRKSFNKDTLRDHLERGTVVPITGGSIDGQVLPATLLFSAQLQGDYPSGNTKSIWQDMAKRLVQPKCSLSEHDDYDESRSEYRTRIGQFYFEGIGSKTSRGSHTSWGRVRRYALNDGMFFGRHRKELVDDLDGWSDDEIKRDEVNMRSKKIAEFVVSSVFKVDDDFKGLLTEFSPNDVLEFAITGEHSHTAVLTNDGHLQVGNSSFAGWSDFPLGDLLKEQGLEAFSLEGKNAKAHGTRVVRAR